MMTAKTTHSCQANHQKHTSALVTLLIGILLAAYLLSGESTSMMKHVTTDICHAKQWQQLPLPLYFFFTEGCGNP